MSELLYALGLLKPAPVPFLATLGMGKKTIYFDREFDCQANTSCHTSKYRNIEGEYRVLKSREDRIKVILTILHDNKLLFMKEIMELSGLSLYFTKTILKELIEEVKIKKTGEKWLTRYSLERSAEC